MRSLTALTALLLVSSPLAAQTVTPGSADVVQTGQPTIATDGDLATAIEASLMNAGFTDITDIDILGGKFTANAAMGGAHYSVKGKQTDKAEDFAQADEEAVKKKLTDLGYEDITKMEKSDNAASAEATKDGEPVMLYLDVDNKVMWEAKEES